jgi:hypothetical protein
MTRLCFLAAALCLLLQGCSDKGHAPDAQAPRAFYYWQTQAGGFDWNDSTFLALGVDRLYVRFFDVGWSEADGAPMPVAPLDRWYQPVMDTVEVVPVVFITNDAFTHLDTAGATALAKQVHRKIMAHLKMASEARFNGRAWEAIENHWYSPTPYRQKSKRFDELHVRDSLYDVELKRLGEVQFDCDWTAGTRAQYFAFLREAKKLFGDQRISSTIRLYQYKYPARAGVPPVDRGMLMCYNAGNIKDPGTVNSIFDRREVMSYLDGKQVYPLPLDYALPVFEWALLYRGGKFEAILSTAQRLREYGYQHYLKDVTDRHATVSEDFTYGYTSQSIFVRQGDEIRFERPDMNDVAAVVAWLHEHKQAGDAALTFYHLNHHDLTKYAPALENMYRTF